MAADVELARIGQLQHGCEAACNLPGRTGKAHSLKAHLPLLLQCSAAQGGMWIDALKQPCMEFPAPSAPEPSTARAPTAAWCKPQSGMMMLAGGICSAA